jgi:hypothetical protein
MDIPSSEIIKAVYALLPGFIAAWVFYGLTAHRRLSPFERTVQALIFTGIIQAIVLAFRELLFLLGNICALGAWSDSSSFVASVIWAIFIGVCFSALANKNWCHKWLRKWGMTQRTSFPSEWFSAFSQEQRYIVLHLVGNRRLYGWPYEWPDHCDSGHFVLMDAEWLSDDGKSTPLTTVQKILIPAKDVEFVEFIKSESEWEATVSHSANRDTP